MVVVVAIRTACSDNKVSRARMKLADIPQDNKQTSSSEPVPALATPMCPPAGIKPLEPSAPGTGHHKVFLHWNAGKPPQGVGYCLYRSTRKKAAEKNPTCQECEQINTYPVDGTACVDDLVQNGAIYHYVTTAITQKRELSKSSNEIRVRIPPFEHPVGHPPRGFYPSCRRTRADNVLPPSP